MIKNKIIAWIKIIRPPIAFITCFGVVISIFNVSNYLNQTISQYQFFMVILTSFLLSSGLMVHNDVTDYKSDKVNRPYKSLITGVISKKIAYYTGIIFLFLSVFLSFLINVFDNGLINLNCGLLTIFIVIIGLYYNCYGKYHGIIGNISVAFGVGIIPYWASIAVFPNELLIMFPLAFAIFIMEIGREIMVNIGDLKGDLKAKFKTLPVQIGRNKSMFVALFFYLLFIPLFPFAYFNDLFGYIYMIGGIILSISLILTWYLTYRVIKKNDEKKIWNAFEKYERVGTRVMIIVFQLFILLEVFY